jgi:DNA-binding transcriptional regulator YdaS (Cro superfamily)
MLSLMAKKRLSERQKESLDALQEAVDLCGTQAELARRIRTEERPVLQQHVWNWLNRDYDVPPEAVIPIETATGVSRHRLRRDIYPEGAEQVA